MRQSRDVLRKGETVTGTIRVVPVAMVDGRQDQEAGIGVVGGAIDAMIAGHQDQEVGTGVVPRAIGGAVDGDPDQEAGIGAVADAMYIDHPANGPYLQRP